MEARREPWPRGWQGRPIQGFQQAKYRFPCIGEHCLSDRGQGWHPAGTLCLPFVDDSPAFENTPTKHQRMCVRCVTNCAGGRWEEVLKAAGFGPRGTESLSGRGDSCQSVERDTPILSGPSGLQSGDPSLATAHPAVGSRSASAPQSSSTDAPTSAGDVGISGASSAPLHPPTVQGQQARAAAPVAKRTGAASKRTDKVVAAEKEGLQSTRGVKRRRSEPNVAGDGKHLTRREERQMARSSFETTCEKHFPTIDQWGRLKWAKGSAGSLNTLHERYPDFPVINPGSARAQAALFLRMHRSLDQAELKQAVLRIFLMQAAGLHFLMCAPELLFHEELRKDPRYNVLNENNTTRDTNSVKLPCVGCGVNDYVLCAGECCARCVSTHACCPSG